MKTRSGAATVGDGDPAGRSERCVSMMDGGLSWQLRGAARRRYLCGLRGLRALYRTPHGGRCAAVRSLAGAWGVSESTAWRWIAAAERAEVRAGLRVDRGYKRRARSGR